MLVSCSLYIYLTHWQIYPHLKDRSSLRALRVSHTVGIGYATVATRLMRKLPRARWPDHPGPPTAHWAVLKGAGAGAPAGRSAE